MKPGSILLFNHIFFLRHGTARELSARTRRFINQFISIWRLFSPFLNMWIGALAPISLRVGAEAPTHMEFMAFRILTPDSYFLSR